MSAEGQVSTYPMANVLQSAAGARDVMGSKIVLAERCSDVFGSNRMMLPWAFPGRLVSTYLQQLHPRRDVPKATFPLRIQAATLICSYDAKRASSSPVSRSQTMAVDPAS